MAGSPSTPGLDEFLGRFGWLSRSVALVAATTPVVLLVEGIRPEAGGRAVDYTLLSALSFVTAVFVYAKCYRTPKRRLQRLYVTSAVTTGVVATTYAILFSEFTESDVLGERYVKGYEYTPEVATYKRLVREARERGDSVDEILSDRELVINFHNDPANVWTHSSISRISFLLHGVLAFLAIPVSATLAFFLLCVPRQRKPKEGSPPGSEGR